MSALNQDPRASLLEEYQNTIYQVNRPKLEIKVGELNEDLSVFLFDNNAFSWAFVSASNPFSIKLSDAENDKRTEALEAFAKERNWRYLPGIGRSPGGSWSEKSLFILDLSKKDALALAEQFEQYAIVFGYMDQEPEILWTGTEKQ